MLAPCHGSYVICCTPSPYAILLLEGAVSHQDELYFFSLKPFIPGPLLLIDRGQASWRNESPSEEPPSDLAATFFVLYSSFAVCSGLFSTSLFSLWVFLLPLLYAPTLLEYLVFLKQSMLFYSFLELFMLLLLSWNTPLPSLP